MEDEKFHNVDPELLNAVTVEDIQSGKIFPEQELDYTTPVPTVDQSIPHSSQDAWLTIELGFDSTIMPGK